MERQSKSGQIDNFERRVLVVYERIKRLEGVTPSNKTIATLLSEETGEKISRNAVARAIRKVAHKLNKQKGW